MVLCALVLWRLPVYKAYSYVESCVGNIHQLRRALDMYATDSSGRFPRRLEVIAPYLRNTTIPTCPAAGVDTYSASYSSASDPDNYTVFCNGANHERADVPPNFPRASERGWVEYGKGRFDVGRDPI